MRLTRTVALAAAFLPALLAPAQAHTPNGATFVTAFRQACLPQRLSYEGTRAHVGSLGWRSTIPETNDELRDMLALADAAFAKDAEEDWTYIRSAYNRIIAGKLHHLVVTHIVAPDVVTLTGCSLYDFGATAGIDPQLITGLLGIPVERTFQNDGLLAHSWGEPADLPGTFQTVLTFIAEDSPHTKLTGFSGLVLKFDTSEPDAAKAAPDAAE